METMFMVLTVICLGIILFLIRRDIRKTKEFDRAFRVLTELDSICSSIIHSRLLKDGEMPEGSAMHAVPKRDWIKWEDIERELKQSEEVQKSYNDISFKGLNNPED